MKKVLAFGASNSKHSINKTFAAYAAGSLSDVDIHVADLNDYASPLYSVDLQNTHGIDRGALLFYELIQQSDALVISLAEYNGLHTAAFKNLWDWMSRIPMEKPRNIWGGKPMFLLSTTPSKRPANHVLQVSKELFPFFGADIIADFYLPSFHHFFKGGAIVEEAYLKLFLDQRNKFQNHLNSI